MVFYRTIRGIFRIVALPMFRFRVEGVENVPPSGAAVVVAPHRSWLDPACVGGACPRPIRFLIRDRVYEKPWARWFYRRMHGLPVTPGGEKALAALRGALRALRAGELVGVFPEGRVVREGESEIIHPGAALLAVQTQVPVIPVHIEGSARAWPHGRPFPGPAPVRVVVGPALPPTGARGRDEVAALVKRIEEALTELAETDR